MRPIPFVLLASIPLSVDGQLWERAYQPSEVVQLLTALPVGGDRWAVIGKVRFGSYVIRVLNEDGTFAWETFSEFFMSHGLGEVVLMPDSGLLHVGRHDGCDYIGPFGRVRRFSADGTLLWERTFEEDLSQPPFMAAKGTIDRIVVASSDSVRIMDMDGNIIGGFQVQSPGISRISWAGDGVLAMIRSANLVLVDLSGTVIATTPIGPMVADMHWNGQEFLVLANDSIRRFGPDLVPIGVAALPDLDPASRFAVSENDLHVVTSPGLYRLEANGDPTFLFPWPALPNHTTMGCAVRGSTVLAVGHTDISGRKTGIVRTLSMLGEAPQHDQDVEVLVQVDSTWTQFVGGNYPWNRHADVTGFVVNHGPDTLRSIVLSMRIQVPQMLCAPPVNRIVANGIAMAPGDTLSLPFGPVYVQMGLPWGQAGGAGEVCIVALAPDRLADRFPEDNIACVPVNFVLGVEEPVRNGFLSVSPNPAANTCMVSGLSAMDAPVRLSIMDLTGRIVAEHPGTSSANSMQLDISGLPPATYILCAEGVRNREILKLVVAGQ